MITRVYRGYTLKALQLGFVEVYSPLGEWVEVARTLQEARDHIDEWHAAP